MSVVSTRYDFIVRLSALKDCFKSKNSNWMKTNTFLVKKWLTDLDMIIMAIDPESSLSVSCLAQQKQIDQIISEDKFDQDTIDDFMEKCSQLVDLTMAELKTITS